MTSLNQFQWPGWSGFHSKAEKIEQSNYRKLSQGFCYKGRERKYSWKGMCDQEKDVKSFKRHNTPFGPLMTDPSNGDGETDESGRRTQPKQHPRVC